MNDLRALRSLGNRIKSCEERLRLLRIERDRLAVQLALYGEPERKIGEAAGLSGSYVNTLKKRRLSGK